MRLTAPLRFGPLFMERVWGGRSLERLFGKPLPPGKTIGESWEVVDRAEAQSVVRDGPLAGETLHALWMERRAEIFGELPDAPRFPLLVKLLDAVERLSVQVHPPPAVAAELGGEPKTEMWYLMHTEGDHDLFVGLRAGVTRESLAVALAHGTVEEELHRIEVRPGDTIFIPSGRIHAIGAGNVIVEIQQNSDTTYRVFDWNRVGFDGRPRALQVEESLRSIDFTDHEPALAAARGETLVDDPLFRVEKWELTGPRRALDAPRFALFTCLEGRVRCGGEELAPGDFFLVPASLPEIVLEAVTRGASVLRTTIPAA